MAKPRTARPETLTGAALLAAAVVSVAGCGAPAASYLHPDMDFSYMERAAVLPFGNLSADPLAGERLQSIFLMQLLEEDALKIVDTRETDAAMVALGLPAGGELTPDQSIALGNRLDVDALFFGVVEEYDPGQGDRTRGPQITGVFGMIETETGAIVWRAQVHDTGGSIWKRLFGGQPDDVYTVSREAVRRALRTLL